MLRSPGPAGMNQNVFCMRLMCSQNQDEVELVRNELLKAGIHAEMRREAIAEAVGVTAIELFVPDARNFLNASKLYARMKERAAGSSGQPAARPQKQTSEPSATAKSNAKQPSSSDRDVKGADSALANAPRREEWKQAASLLEKGMAEIFRLESELNGECASLQKKVEELSQALTNEKAALAHEVEGRVASEKNQAAQLSALSSTLERERQKWQQQLKGSDDSLKASQEKIESMSRMLQAKDGVTATLKEQIVALGLRLEEHKTLVLNARTEALAEREARIAAEERAQKLGETQASLEKERLKHKELEQQMQAHVASLTSLFRKPGS